MKDVFIRYYFESMNTHGKWVIVCVRERKKVSERERERKRERENHYQPFYFS